MKYTPFAGLTALEENDPITIDGASFLVRNPVITDHLLQVGAVTHRHDARPALSNPLRPMDGGIVGTGGQIDANSEFAVAYTIVDNHGGETAASPALLLSTAGATVEAPSVAPSGSVDYTQGIMPDGTYFYALTYTDGAGGETTIGPSTVITIDPGSASGAIGLSGLAAGLGEAQSWRLWRSYEGEDWHLVTQGFADTFLDAGYDPPDNPARPPDASTISGSAQLVVTLPTASEEPALASGALTASGTTAVKINVYLAPTTGFVDPCLYAQLDISAAGSTLTITSDTVSAGSPPRVSTSTPGARQIYPETDLAWGVKSPVATFEQLPPGTRGDVRLTVDTHEIYGVLGPYASGPPGWTLIGPGSESWREPAQSLSDLSPFDSKAGDVRVVLDLDEAFVFASGGVDNMFMPAAQGSYPRGLGDPVRTSVGNLMTDGEYLYWGEGPAGDSLLELGDRYEGGIARAKLDGTEANHTWITNCLYPHGLCVGGDHIYFAEGGVGWDDAGVGAWISRANLDGTGAEHQWMMPGGKGFYNVVGMAVSNDRLYIACWGVLGPETGWPPGLVPEGAVILSSNLDGSDVQLVLDFANVPSPEVSGGITPGLPEKPTHFAADETHIYWTFLAGPTYGAISRAKLDGTEVETPWVVLSVEGAGPPAENDDYPFDLKIADGYLFYGGGQVYGGGSNPLANPRGTIGRINLATGKATSWWRPVKLLADDWPGGSGQVAAGTIQSLAYAHGSFYFTSNSDSNGPFPILPGAMGPPAVIGRDYLGRWIPLAGSGAGSWKAPVASVGNLPSADNTDGDARVVRDTDTVYVWHAEDSTWVSVTGGIGLTGPPGDFHWEGAYAPGTAYAAQAVVRGSDGSSYVSLASGNVGNDPTSSPTQWDLVAAHGAPGPAGSGGGGASGAVLAVQARGNPAVLSHVTLGSPVKVNLLTTDWDFFPTTDPWDATNHRYVVPVDGLYRVHVKFIVNGFPTVPIELALAQNATVIESRQGSVTYGDTLELITLLPLYATDLLEPYAGVDNSGISGSFTMMVELAGAVALPPIGGGIG